MIFMHGRDIREVGQAMLKPLTTAELAAENR
jgi:hypothetical protein